MSGVPPGKATAGVKAAAVPGRPANSKVSKDGLADDVLTQIAQAKFEVQEERLREVARQTMSLLRDFAKESPETVSRRIGDAQKALLKYEMQTIRSWELQERRRAIEIGGLGAEAERCRREAEEEADKIVGLNEKLELEKRRRKRYEGYEQAATEINRKRPRADSQAKIADITAELERLSRQSQELDVLMETRHKRAHLLKHAVAELKADLRSENHTVAQALGTGAAVSCDDDGEGDACAADAGASPTAGDGRGPAAADLVEVS